jgi:CheY-like chemotaxis protein
VTAAGVRSSALGHRCACMPTVTLVLAWPRARCPIYSRRALRAPRRAMFDAAVSACAGPSGLRRRRAARGCDSRSDVDVTRTQSVSTMRMSSMRPPDGDGDMTVFISHSFDNQPEFENVADSLTRVGISFWEPKEVQSGGETLRDQLRIAVNKCMVCIFVATHRSVASSWCGAELGAFWGAGRPIIVYLADSSLMKDELPPIVEGDVWERNLSRIADRALQLVSSAVDDGAGSSIPGATRVAAMTAAELQKLIAGAVSLVNAGRDEAARGTDLNTSLESLTQDAAGRVLRGAAATKGIGEGPDRRWEKSILWVDDRPDNNRHERLAFESLGLEIKLAESTDEAMRALDSGRFGAIISDMGRREGPREGYKLLELVRVHDKRTPFFIYAGSRAPEHEREAIARGAQGITNVASDLLNMVTEALGSLP